MGSIEVLRGRRVYLDTNIVIYILEKPDAYADMVLPLLDTIASGECECITAELTVTEVLPGVVRTGNQDAIKECVGFFESGDVVELRATSREAFYKAGLLRAQSGMSTPDAIHMMTAVDSRCHVFLTNDKHIRATHEIDVIQLSEMQI